jgi:hypothetical protein
MKVIARYRSEKMSGNWSQDMKIVPVISFRTQGYVRTLQVVLLLEHDG